MTAMPAASPATSPPQRVEPLLVVRRFSILQSDFGYEPYSALFGALAVKDKVDIVVVLRPPRALGQPRSGQHFRHSVMSPPGEIRL